MSEEIVGGVGWRRDCAMRLCMGRRPSGSRGDERARQRSWKRLQASAAARIGAAPIE